MGTEPQKPAQIKTNTGRLVAGLTAVAGLCTALAPLVADLDTTSTIGLVGGLGAIAPVIYKWLDNWGRYEQDLRDPEKLNEPGP